ncbi:uncharacterized protein LOC136077055 isoform X2 [Hydra vulgaris]|uniref:Uncharacterized protein LOC136077055 isoform X2 n=1 Tax=Hydra vulgaris TaxID=6087 RepID=A0ABM4BF18_HYDVU
MKFSRLITVLIWRCYFHSETFAAILPSLLWDPRNYLFSCENLTLKARIDDRINLICPKAELNSLQLVQHPNEIDLFEKIYLLNEDQFLNYETCNTSFLPSSNFAWLCNKNFSHYIVFDDNPLDSKSKPKFVAGMTYYLISTSEQTESKLNQNIGGSCRGNPSKRMFTLKLKIYVCTKNEVENNMCDVCQTASCYEKGCGKWLTLSDSYSNHIWNGSHCLRKVPRQCISPYFQCDKLPYSYEVENKKEACKLGDLPTLLHSMFARLTKIEQKLDTCLTQQKMILKVVGSSKVVVALPDNISLPLYSIVQLEHLEQVLLEKSSLDALIMHLGQIGGRTVAETVRNVLSELMATEVAQQINFEGRGGQKQGIKTMKILSAIYGAVQHNPYTKDATKMEVNENVKSWLRNSCDRKKSDGSGGRKRRSLDSSTNKRLKIISAYHSQLRDNEGDADDK